MDLDVVFLGTAASMPTAQRAPAALLVRRGSERLLFDCGEGTQRQLQRSEIGLPDLQEIFLTHFHADHFLGLPGMLKTFALRGRGETPLTVYGPRGLRELFKRLHPFLGRLPYPLALVELDAGERIERGDYTIVFENDGARDFDLGGVADVSDADYDSLRPVPMAAPGRRRSPTAVVRRRPVLHAEPQSAARADAAASSGV